MALSALEMGPDVEECMDNCFEAAQAAERCATECVEMGEPERARCIKLCQDVADLTTQHARLMARESEYHQEVAAICADLCETCADECEQYEGTTMQVCAEACRRCADSCRRMAG